MLSLFDEIANDDGSITAEDFVQYFEEVLYLVKNQKGDKKLAEISNSQTLAEIDFVQELTVCICVIGDSYIVCLCVEF